MENLHLNGLSIVRAVFFLCAFLVVYVYAGYPLIMLILSKIGKGAPVKKDEKFFPRVSILIAAYNEEAVIAERLENLLSLDYPAEKTEIIIASDASSDATDAIIASYAGKGIILNRRPERKGKMAAINDSVAKASGEILVFSDADIMFKPDAVSKLVRNFADPSVGCVGGIKRILTDGHGTAGSEGAYWKYELRLKELEGHAGSVAAGVSGCNFAMRKELYAMLDEKTTGEDLALPLLCVLKGYRVVFEREAVTYERLLPEFSQEYRRKIRIVTGGLHAVALISREGGLFRLDGFTLFKLVSHKILRWYVSVCLVLLFAANCLLPGPGFRAALACQLLLYGLAAAGWRLYRSGRGGAWRKLVDIPFYFAAMNAASLAGITRHLTGKHKGWTQYTKTTQGMAGAVKPSP